MLKKGSKKLQGKCRKKGENRIEEKNGRKKEMQKILQEKKRQ